MSKLNYFEHILAGQGMSLNVDGMEAGAGVRAVGRGGGFHVTYDLLMESMVMVT